jgi:hypothetical protein
MTPLPPLGDLELLARHAPTIFGKALDPDRPTLTPAPASGRPDWVDSKSGAGGELGRAVGALRALLALQSEGPVGYQTACVMWVCRVQCSAAGRVGVGYVRVSEAFGTLGPLPPEPPKPPQRGGRRPPDKATRDADRRLKAAYEVWTSAREKRADEGFLLYDEAVALWRGREQRRTG